MLTQDVADIAGEWRADRADRQARSGLDPADFERLAKAGFLHVAVPEEIGGLWWSIGRPPKTRPRGLPPAFGRAPRSLAFSVHPDAPAHYGVRVPTFVISPRVPKGGVSNVLFDHTSIAKSILLRFLGADHPALSPRMSRARHFGSLLTSDLRSDRPQIDPPPPPPQERELPDGGQLPLVPIPGMSTNDTDDHHEAMRRFGLPIL